MDDVTTGLIVLIEENGERAVIKALKHYCASRAYPVSIGDAQMDEHSKAWAKLDYRLQGALDGMDRGQFGRVR